MSSTPVPIDTLPRRGRHVLPGAGRGLAVGGPGRRRPGLGYAVLTTKHHDGFALWPSALSDWTIARTAYRGDLVGEFADACRAEGLRVGFYHSLLGLASARLPGVHRGDEAVPVHRLPAAVGPGGVGALPRRCCTGRCGSCSTGYGDVDVLWFDGQWERTAAEWKADELRALIRSLAARRAW